MLFTVLNPESKFKSKSLIDTVLQRGADTAAQWLYRAVAGIGWRHRVVARRCASALLGLTRRSAGLRDARQTAAAPASR
jgi:AAA family ATP:ADP antiporter